MAPSVIHVSGTITGDVEVRLTRNDIAVCRFRLTQTPIQWDATTHKWRDETPIQWDATTHKWRDETPIPYICTAWRDLARNAATALADGTNVLATGHITEIRNNSIYLTIDDLGISLHRRPAHYARRPPHHHTPDAPAHHLVPPGRRATADPTPLVDTETDLQPDLARAFTASAHEHPARRPPPGTGSPAGFAPRPASPGPFPPTAR
ncbi:single-stranded DNA-binding protein [Streptomyces sp. NPDC055099]